MSCACFKLHRSRSCNCEYECIANVPLQFMDELSALRYIMTMIYVVDEQQLRTLSCVHYTIFSVVKLHTNTVRESHSCSGKKYAYASRTYCSLLFMLSIAINRAEHVCATVIIKRNYMLMCNHKIVINIMLCL